MEQRTFQKLSLPLDPDGFSGPIASSHSLIVWGTKNNKAQLLEIDFTNISTQGSYTTPNNWQVSGLAINKNVLILSPSEPAPPGNSKAIIGLQPNTGKVLWEHSTSGFMFTPPTADEQLACAVDSHGTLVAVNPMNGKSAWTAIPQLGDYPHRGIAPVLSQHHVLAVESEARGAGLIAFQRANGETVWKFDPPENAKVDFAPVVINDFAFVLAEEWLYRVALTDGSWTRLSKSERKTSQGWYFAVPVADEKQVYLLEGGFIAGKPGYVLHAHDASTGQSLWQMNLDRRPYQPPTLSEDHLFFVDRDGTLFCLDKLDGQIIWQEHLGSEPAAALVVTQDSIFVLTRDAILHTIKLSSPIVDISQPPNFYEQQGGWSLAAGAYLANNQPFEAGLALLKIDDYRQALLAFNLTSDVEKRIRALIESHRKNNNDVIAAELAEDWGMLLIERLGGQAQGNSEVAEWFEQAVESFMLANQSMQAFACQEQAAQVMETPRIKLEVITNQDTRWAVNEPILMKVAVTNFGYGPARRVTIKVSGNIKKPHPAENYENLAVDQTRTWDNVRVIPNSAGAGLLKFTIDYESYRTKQVLQTEFTHPIQVEKNRDTAILRALHNGGQIHIEKYISPGATHNEIAITDSKGIVVGDKTQLHSELSSKERSEVSNSTKENQMEPVTLIVSALLGGLTSGLTDTAKAATKDIYDALRSRLMKKADKNEDAQDAITKIEKQPDSKARQELLKEELNKLDLGKDEELLKLAQSLLDALKATSGNGGKFNNLNIQNNQGVVIGDNANVTQNFGDTNRGNADK